MVHSMNLPFVEYAVRQGMDLIITEGPRGDFIAHVSTPRLERQATGASIPAALEALEQLLSQIGPKP